MKAHGWVMMSPFPENPEKHYQTITGRIYDCIADAVIDCQKDFDAGKRIPVLIEYEQVDKSFSYDKHYNQIIKEAK